MVKPRAPTSGRTRSSKESTPTNLNVTTRSATRQKAKEEHIAAVRAERIAWEATYPPLPRKRRTRAYVATQKAKYARRKRQKTLRRIYKYVKLAFIVTDNYLATRIKSREGYIPDARMENLHYTLAYGLKRMAKRSGMESRMKSTLVGSRRKLNAGEKDPLLW